MTDLSFASGQRFMRFMLILTLVLGAVAPSGATASSTGSCREYLEAKDAKESAFLLLEQRRDEASEGLAKDAAARWRQARKAVIASLKAGGDKMLGHILAAWEKARNEGERAVFDTMFWISLTTGEDPQGRARAETVTVSDAMDAVYAAEHATIALACRLSEKTRP